MYFRKFDKEWPCEYVAEGDRLDEAAFESMSGRQVKVIVVRVCPSHEREWCDLVKKKEPLVILESVGEASVC